MHIAVFVKQVPDTSEIQIDRTTNRLIRDGVPSILNPFDCFAVETALRLKEKHGGTITVITMGPKQAVSVLKKCCALGFDNAYFLNDIAFAGSDTYSTGYILSTALTEIEKIHGKADLILVGKQAIDGDTAQVGPIISEFLDLPQITCATELPEINEGIASVTRETPDGTEKVRVSLPALISVSKTKYELRYESLGGIVRSNRREYPVLTLKDLPSLERSQIGHSGSPTVTRETFTPEFSSEVIMLDEGSMNDNAARLASVFHSAGLL